MTDRTPGNVERHGLVVDLVPSKRDEYLRLHAEVWPEVEATLSEHHVTNYTIFAVDNTLFAYYEYRGEDHNADLAAIARDESTQKWWSLTAPCQTVFGSAKPGHDSWRTAREIWHLP